MTDTHKAIRQMMYFMKRAIQYGRRICRNIQWKWKSGNKIECKAKLLKKTNNWKKVRGFLFQKLTSLMKRDLYKSKETLYSIFAL